MIARNPADRCEFLLEQPETPFELQSAVGDVTGKNEPVRCFRQPDRAARYRLMTSSGQVVRGS